MFIKGQFLHFLADIPVYASIAWIYVTKIIDPNLFPEWEEWLFYHGWLLLLALRLGNAIFDAWKRVLSDQSKGDRDENGRFVKKPDLSTFEKIKLVIETLWKR